MWASITVVKWKWKFLEKLFQILSQSSSISGHRNTEVQLYFLQLQTLNFCKILVCIQVLTPDLTLSGALQPCQVTFIINLPPGTLPDMDIALVEVTVRVADHLSWSAGKNNPIPAGLRGIKDSWTDRIPALPSDSDSSIRCTSPLPKVLGSHIFKNLSPCFFPLP